MLAKHATLRAHPPYRKGNMRLYLSSTMATLSNLETLSCTYER